MGGNGLELRVRALDLKIPRIVHRLQFFAWAARNSTNIQDGIFF
jgi:hypothetical protein